VQNVFQAVPSNNIISYEINNTDAFGHNTNYSHRKKIETNFLDTFFGNLKG
jgi:hypothetical protein